MRGGGEEKREIIPLQALGYVSRESTVVQGRCSAWSGGHSTGEAAFLGSPALSSSPQRAALHSRRKLRPGVALLRRPGGTNGQQRNTVSWEQPSTRVL